MKVTAIDSCVLTVPTPKPMALQYPQHKLVVAQIVTDQGVRGLGYSLVFGGGGAEAVHAYLEARLKPALIGEDPTYVGVPVGKDVPRRPGDEEAGRGGVRAGALDIGLWDIVGKVLDKPLYKLWGAMRHRIACYGSGGWAKYSVRTTWSAKRRSTPATAAGTTR